jgi:hypothetical protein
VTSREIYSALSQQFWLSCVLSKIIWIYL